MFGLFYRPDADLTEMNKLKDLLDKEGIPYDYRVRLNGGQVIVPSEEAYDKEELTAISVVCFDGTYGFEKGLIEVYAPQLNEGVEGWLNAEEAFEYIKDTQKGISRGSCG